MKSLIVDASVACKWYLPEENRELAKSLLVGEATLLAPELLFAELDYGRPTPHYPTDGHTLGLPGHFSCQMGATSMTGLLRTGEASETVGTVAEGVIGDHAYH